MAIQVTRWLLGTFRSAMRLLNRFNLLTVKGTAKQAPTKSTEIENLEKRSHNKHAKPSISVNMKEK